MKHKPNNVNTISTYEIIKSLFIRYRNSKSNLVLDSISVGINRIFPFVTMRLYKFMYATVPIEILFMNVSVWWYSDRYTILVSITNAPPIIWTWLRSMIWITIYFGSELCTCKDGFIYGPRKGTVITFRHFISSSKFFSQSKVIC